MAEGAWENWSRGGVRYAKLRAVVPEFLAPESVLSFFVAVDGRGGKARLANPFTPFQREYVVAVTDENVVALRLKLPGVFRASIADEVLRRDRWSVKAEWREDQLFLEGQRFGPIAFHEEDAEEVAGLLGC